MDDKILENCPYLDSGQCPQPNAVGRAYLVPQLLDRAEIEATKKVCRTCGRYLDDKRKHSRLEKPLRVIVLKGENTTVKGEIVDIGKGGALIRLKSWLAFEKEEEVGLRIYHSPHEAGEKMVSNLVRTMGLVKRIEPQKKQVAIVFLEELDE